MPPPANTEIDQLKEKIRKLEEDLRQAHEEIDKLTRLADEKLKNPQNRVFLLGQQASDKEIIGQFESLLCRIRTWSTKFTKDAELTYDLSAEMYEDCRQVSYSCREREGLVKILSNAKERRVFARGLAARIIGNTVFRTHQTKTHDSSTGQDYWLNDQTRRAYQLIEDKLYSIGLFISIFE